MSNAELMDELLGDLKRRYESLTELVAKEKHEHRHWALLNKRLGLQIAIDMIEARRKDLK